MVTGRAKPPAHSPSTSESKFHRVEIPLGRTGLPAVVGREDRRNACGGQRKLTWDGQAAEFISRFLKHPALDTAAKSMGVVAHVHGAGIDFWRRNEKIRQRVAWPKS